MRRACAGALALALAAVAVSACGSPSGDVWAVQRHGGGPDMTMIVHDDGTVSCNGKQHELASALLVEARNNLGSLEDAATAHESLPPGPAPVIHYTVDTPSGYTSFWDDSGHKRPSFTQVAAMTLQACGAP
jgi:hypothetical protein